MAVSVAVFLLAAATATAAVTAAAAATGAATFINVGNILGSFEEQSGHGSHNSTQSFSGFFSGFKLIQFLNNLHS